MQSENPRSLNLALLGYGKMGKSIAQLAPQRGFEVRLVVTSESSPAIAAAAQRRSIVAEDFQDIDVCVDFTAPAAVVENVRRVGALGCNLVVGTTGWRQHLDEVRTVVEDAGIGMVYAANFSIGVQLFYRAAEAAAKIFAGFPMYQPYITETHHSFKKDAPSGTAMATARQLASAGTFARPPTTMMKTEGARGAEIDGVGVHSLRLPGVVAHQEVLFGGNAELLSIRHDSFSRESFMPGVVLAVRAAATLDHFVDGLGELL